MENARRFLIFYLNSKKFATEISKIERIIRMVEITSVPKMETSIMGLIDFHGTIVPILNLHKRFGFKIPKSNLNSKILLMKNGELFFGFIIDDVDGVYPFDELQIVEAEKVIPGLGNKINEIRKQNDEFIMLYEVDKILTNAEKKFMTELIENK